jgi:hypothetical protein
MSRQGQRQASGGGPRPGRHHVPAVQFVREVDPLEVLLGHLRSALHNSYPLGRTQLVSWMQAVPDHQRSTAFNALLKEYESITDCSKDGIMPAEIKDRVKGTVESMWSARKPGSV